MLQIRDSVENDSNAIESLYPLAFPDEDLIPLVRELLRNEQTAISLVACLNSAVVGHAIFSQCHVPESNTPAALLGPLVVNVSNQKQGIGSAVVRHGLRQLEHAGVIQVFVLGDPAYYQRLGFQKEVIVKPPYVLPAAWDGAWQSQTLRETDSPGAGTLSVPEPWRRPALWAP